MSEETTLHAPIEHAGRKGFLPIKTNTFDRVFISVVIFVAVHLLWMRFIECLFAPVDCYDHHANSGRHHRAQGLRTHGQPGDSACRLYWLQATSRTADRVALVALC